MRCCRACGAGAGSARRRASDELRRRFSVPVAIHEEEAPLLQVRCEETFQDGARLCGAFEAVRFHDLKSPAECAFFWRERGALFIGDLVTGLPSGLGDGEPVLGRARKSLEDFLAAGGAPARWPG